MVEKLDGSDSRLLHTRFCINSFLKAILLTMLIIIECQAGISYLPNQNRNDAQKTLNIEFSLAVLSWQLPGGLLIADRLAPVGDSRFGDAFKPHENNSEWFLVRISRNRINEPEGTLSDFGWIHLRDSDFVLLEVSLDMLTEFAALSIEKVRILQDQPPAGCKYYPASIENALRHTTTSTRSTIDNFLDRGDEIHLNNLHQQITGYAEFLHQGMPHTIHTRYYSTDDKTLVADYLGAKLSRHGYVVTYETFSVGSIICRNVIATKAGKSLPDEYVVIGGHYDSTSEQATILAPGADDNGSGSSLVMEIARMAATFEFDRSIQFVLFDSEEQGLNGSSYFVNSAVGSGRVIVAAIIADMVSYYNTNYGVIIEGEPDWEPLMSVMENCVAYYTTLKSRKDYYSWGSDHVPFQQAGIPAFLAIEWDWASYPYYHNSQDNWEHIEQTAIIGFEISQACAATLAEVAGLRAKSVPTLTYPVIALIVLLLSLRMVRNFNRP